MDRQHPRDLFDVMELFAHDGITSAIRRAFVVYLASHNRTIHEVLSTTRVSAIPPHGRPTTSSAVDCANSFGPGLLATAPNAFVHGPLPHEKVITG
jgi:hypothetical protein